MYFEIDEFLETLVGLTHSQTYKMIASQQDELLHEVSLLKMNNTQTVMFRSFEDEIEFLNKLGNEVEKGLIVRSTIIDRKRIDKVLKNLSN
jgi:hypothetical protein